MEKVPNKRVDVKPPIVAIPIFNEKSVDYFGFRLKKKMDWQSKSKI